MSYEVTIDNFLWDELTPTEYSEPEPQLPEEGDYRNAGRIWDFSSRLVFDKSSAATDDTKIRDEFNRRLEEWRKDIRGVSSLSEIVMNPAYQRIMAMGEPALRLILSDLRDNSGHWFYALRYIAGEDKATGTKTMADAKAAWLEWGYKNGHI